MDNGTASSRIEPGRRPNKILPVPPEYQVAVHAREGHMLVNDILVKTSCTVVPSWDHGKITRFELYGLGTEQATVMINKWISNAHQKSKAASAWGKTPAFNNDEWYYQQIVEMETERKQMFKGPVPTPTEYATELPSAIVDWPEDLRNHPVTPRDAFGNKLEALNELRMRDEVFITLLPNTKGLWQVKITGFTANAVRLGEQHYRNMIEQVRTDTVGLQIGLNIILDLEEGVHVLLGEAEEWWPNRADKVVPRLIRSSLMEPPGDYFQDGLDPEHLEPIQKHVKQALEMVQSKKGAYDFAIRLGCLALGVQKIPLGKIGSKVDKATFLDAINNRIDVAIKKWAFDDELGCKIMKRLIAATDLLEPIKSAGFFGYLPSTLEQTIPVFRGTWVFNDPTVLPSQPVTAASRHAGRPTLPQQHLPPSVASSAPTSLFVVQVDWTDDENGKYEKTGTRFYKLKPGKKAPKVNMDINLLELVESRGWTFALESLIPVSRELVSPALVGFAQNVSMPPKYDVTSKQNFVRWESTPTIQRYLTHHRIDKTYSFGLRDTCYKVEFTAMWYPRRKQTPVWGLAVRHMQWSTHLAELERLPIGNKADWGDVVATFLPEDGQMSSPAMVDSDTKDKKSETGHADGDAASSHNGIRILGEKLMQISSVVSSVTDSSGGGGISLSEVGWSA